MSDDHEIHVDHGMVIPKWMQWAGGIAVTSLIGLIVGSSYALFTGGVQDFIVDTVRAAETADGSPTQTAQIHALTASVAGLTSAIEAQQALEEQERQRDAEFRTEVRTQLNSLNNAMFELSRPTR